MQLSFSCTSTLLHFFQCCGHIVNSQIVMMQQVPSQISTRNNNICMRKVVCPHWQHHLKTKSTVEGRQLIHTVVPAVQLSTSASRTRRNRSGSTSASRTRRNRSGSTSASRTRRNRSGSTSASRTRRNRSGSTSASRTSRNRSGPYSPNGF